MVKSSDKMNGKTLCSRRSEKHPRVAHITSDPNFTFSLSHFRSAGTVPFAKVDLELSLDLAVADEMHADV